MFLKKLLKISHSPPRRYMWSYSYMSWLSDPCERRVQDHCGMSMRFYPHACRSARLCSTTWGTRLNSRASNSPATYLALKHLSSRKHHHRRFWRRRKCSSQTRRWRVPSGTSDKTRRWRRSTCYSNRTKDWRPNNEAMSSLSPHWHHPTILCLPTWRGNGRHNPLSPGRRHECCWDVTRAWAILLKMTTSWPVKQRCQTRT